MNSEYGPSQFLKEPTDYGRKDLWSRLVLREIPLLYFLQIVSLIDLKQKLANEVYKDNMHLDCFFSLKFRQQKIKIYELEQNKTERFVHQTSAVSSALLTCMTFA